MAGWKAATCPTCGLNKTRYLTRAQAKSLGRQREVRLRVYRCGDFWHLTSSTAAVVQWYRKQVAS